MVRYLRELGPGGRRSVDFTSSLYLGIRHPSRSLRPWSQLTTGKPAALETAPSAQATAEALARLQGCERAILLPSTLHLFFDLFEVLRQVGIRIYTDAAAYPIALWGAERVAARGVPLRQIPHYDPRAARLAIEEDDRTHMRPVIVADGFCPDCGRPVPLREYLQCVTPHSGYLVLDDTQALGIWGTAPGLKDPYGSGGGGSLRLHAFRSPHVILGSSLAKGFGVPLAALSGSARLIHHFVQRSETRVHTSPTSIAVLHAAEHALGVNEPHGDEIRLRLAQLVMNFRKIIPGTGLCDTGSLFPVQMLALDRERSAVRVQRLLLNAGVRTAVVRGAASPEAKLVFVINALHSTGDINQATRALKRVLQDWVPDITSLRPAAHAFACSAKHVRYQSGYRYRSLYSIATKR
jgi:8-amino-7-oxononanoate synthase